MVEIGIEMREDRTEMHAKIIIIFDTNTLAMPMENMVHMFGGTKKKSTLVDERVIFFAREDEDSPRQDILSKFCAPEVKGFRSCMSANNNDENKCLEPKGLLDKCAGAAFKEVNSAGPGKWVY